MFRLDPALRAGLLGAALWLASGAAFALIVWFGLYRGDVVRLVVAETIPVETWQLRMPWPVVLPLASSVAFGAAITTGIGRLTAGGRPAPLLASWMIAVLAGAAVGAVTGIGAVIGNGTPPRLAFLAQGVPDAIGVGLSAGLLLGWAPAWWARARRPASEVTTEVTGRAMPTLASALIAASAALVLVVATGVVVAQARQAGLAGEPPPSVQEPDPAPSATPPPSVASGDHPGDPSWCLSSQLLMQAGGADGATGHRAALLLATNTSSDPCTLPGYPDVAFADETGNAVPATVRDGGGFLTEDPGAHPFELAPGGRAVAHLAWDATDGRTLLNQVYIAPWRGAERVVTFVQPEFDITAQTEVGVTAWAPADDSVTLGSAP